MVYTILRRLDSRVRAASVLSGGALALAYPPLAWWPVAWLALIPWYVVLSRPSAPALRGGARRGWHSGFLFGLTLFLVGMAWMNAIGAGVWIGLSCIEAAPFALLGGVCGLLMPRLPAGRRPWVFAALWTLGEGLRGWGRYSFPWFFLASTQVRALPLVQIVSLTGQWGLSFLIAVANGFLAEAWLSRGAARLRVQWAAGAGALVSAAAVGGLLAMKTGRPEEFPTRSVAAVQGSFLKPVGARYTADDRTELLRIYTDLTRQAAESHPAFIAWPETVTPGDVLHDPVLPGLVGSLARYVRTPLLVGSLVVDEKRGLRNSAVLIGEGGTFQGQYDKTQLVPFGEFVPLRRYLPLLERYKAPKRDFQPGTSSGILRAGEGPGPPVTLGVLICYESAYPHLSAARVRRGAQALVLLTSDQTFGDTAGPYQHADLAVLRAVETRRWLVRAASTGISQIVDPRGHIRARLGIGERGVLSGDIRLRNGLTLYARWGDWFLGVCALIVAGALIHSLPPFKRGPAASGPGGTPPR